MAAALLAAAACDQRALVGIVSALPGGDAGSDASYAVDIRDKDGVGVLDECGAGNEAGLSTADVERLRAGGDTSAMRLLYPYDGTVFPRGLASPLTMWDGPNVDAIWLRLSNATFRYEGCLRPTGAGRAAIPQRAWEAAEADSDGRTTTYTLEVATLANGRVLGPVRSQLTLSGTRLLGSVYYATYGSRIPANLGTGSVMRVPLGGTATTFLGTPGCAGCHAVDATGHRALASENAVGMSYSIAGGKATPSPSAPITGLTGGEFAAIEPGGALYVTTAHPTDGTGVGPRSFGAGARAAAGLFITASGTEVRDSMLPSGAMMPAFSPEGDTLIFNDAAMGMGHGLSSMHFDSLSGVFSAYAQLYVHETLYPSFPSVVPGDGRIVFAIGETKDFSASAARLFGSTARGPRSDLMVLDPLTKDTVLLAKAMGFASAEDSNSDTTYLPFGGEELHQSYYPSVLPQASPDHTFVFFDGIRHYGNLGIVRGIWAAAISPAGPDHDASDPSHPAFFLPGQELETENIRPVAALDAP